MLAPSSTLALGVSVTGAELRAVLLRWSWPRQRIRFGEEIWNDRLCRNAEPVAKMVAECDAEFSGECALVRRMRRGSRVRGRCEYPPLTLRLVTWRRTDIALRAVGVQRYLGPVERHEQFGLVGVQSPEQAVERGEPGAFKEDPVEACTQFATARRGGVGANTP